MSIEAPAHTSALHETANVDVLERRSAGYHPSVWGDRFLNYPPVSMVIMYD